MTRVECNVCLIEKDVFEMKKNIRHKLGCEKICKSCVNDKRRAIYDPEKNKQYKQEHKEHIKQYRITNTDRIYEQRRKAMAANTTEFQCIQCKKQIQIQTSTYNRKKNKDVCKDCNAEYCLMQKSGMSNHILF